MMRALPQWLLAPVIDSLVALRGIDKIVAIVLLAKLGGITRVDNGRVRRSCGSWRVLSGMWSDRKCPDYRPEQRDALYTKSEQELLKTVEQEEQVR
ncbi:MAG: hypothetical protein ACK5ME_02355 [Parahaliea sp.]